MGIWDGMKKLAGKVAGWVDKISGRRASTHIINQAMKEYGEIRELKIDNKKKSMTASVLLNGESKPIMLTVDQYEISKDGSSSQVVVHAASSDRAWVNAILKNFVVGKKLDVPANWVDFLDRFLG